MLVKLDMVLFVNINCKYVVITDPINQFQTESISFQPSSDWSKSVGHPGDGTLDSWGPCCHGLSYENFTRRKKSEERRVKTSVQ